jgi:hypothetical protein
MLVLRTKWREGGQNNRGTPGCRCLEDYRAYPTWAAGAVDWYALIRTLYTEGRGLRTPAAILPHYAPAGEGNDPALCRQREGPGGRLGALRGI